MYFTFITFSWCFSMFNVKMGPGFGGLQSRPEVRSCGGEGSYGVTWECRVGWSCRVEVELRYGGAEMRRCGVTVYGVGFRM